jgi:hypothetical protein
LLQPATWTEEEEEEEEEEEYYKGDEMLIDYTTLFGQLVLVC